LSNEIIFTIFNFRVEGEGQSVKGSSQKLVDLGFKYKFSVEDILTASVECAKRFGGL
jgi:hypothetical protein